MTETAQTSKIALITGGSRGLGKSGALHLAAQGVGVVITYRSSADEAEAIVEQIRAEGGKAAALSLDVAKLAQFDGFIARFQQVLQDQFQRDTFDFLVNNAGVGIYGPLAELDEDKFDALMHIHFKGPFFLTQRLLPLIANGGRILNLSTGLTRFSFPGYGTYASMKGAVEVWTRYLAKELGHRGIAANVLAPGAIATDFGGGAVRDTPELQQQLAAHTALGRVGEADDIGAMMASLLHPNSYWVNGQRIEASGGMQL